jgi:hypothetical protein
VGTSAANVEPVFWKEKKSEKIATEQLKNRFHLNGFVKKLGQFFYICTSFCGWYKVMADKP